MPEYKNKSVNYIENELNDAFQKRELVDATTRDDRLILQESSRIIRKYISEIQKLESSDKVILQPLINLLNEIEDEEKNIKDQDAIRIMFDSHEQSMIKRYAEKINLQEDNVVKRLQMSRENKKQELASRRQASESKEGKPYFNVLQDGTIKLTDRANKPTLGQLLAESFPGENGVYAIDYTYCVNHSIKNKIQKILGSLKGYIQYFPRTKEYYFVGKPIGDNYRALGAEGVKLKKSSLQKLERSIKEQNNNQITSDKKYTGPVARIPTNEELKRNYQLPIFKVSSTNRRLAIHKLREWCKKTNAGAYLQERYESHQRHIYKDKDKIQDYVDYDLAVFAFQCYIEKVNQHDLMLKKKAGFSSEEEFAKKSDLIMEYYKTLPDRFEKEVPHFEVLERYLHDINNIAKKHGIETQQQVSMYEKSYKKIENELSLLDESYQIEEVSNRLGTAEIHSSDDLTQYLMDMNNINEYSQKRAQVMGTPNGKIALKYIDYMKDISSIIKSYNPNIIQKAQRDLKDYHKYIKSHRKGFFGNDVTEKDFKNFETYQESLKKSSIPQYRKSISGMYDHIFKDSHTDKSAFRVLKNDAIKAQMDQESIDAVWQSIEDFNEGIYYRLNTLASIRNGVINATVKTGSGLRLLGSSLYKNENQMMASLDFKEKFDNFLTVGLSQKMKDSPVLIGDNGERSINPHAIVSQGSMQLVNLLALIYGGGTIAKGVKSVGAGLALKVSSTVAQRAGLFSMAYMQSAGEGFEQAKLQGMGDSEALQYTILTSTISSGLELISPNEIIAGSGTHVIKNYIKTLVKDGSRKWSLQAGKMIFKILGAEALEENLQETTQLAVGNMLNERANDHWDVKMQSDWSAENFVSTMLLTTLTVGIATTPRAISTTQNVLGGGSQKRILTDIIRNDRLYDSTIETIDNIVAGTTHIKGVDVQSVQEIKNLLQSLHNDVLKKTQVLESFNDMKKHPKESDSDFAMRKITFLNNHGAFPEVDGNISPDNNMNIRNSDKNVLDYRTIKNSSSPEELFAHFEKGPLSMDNSLLLLFKLQSMGASGEMHKVFNTISQSKSYLTNSRFKSLVDKYDLLTQIESLRAGEYTISADSSLRTTIKQRYGDTYPEIRLNLLAKLDEAGFEYHRSQNNLEFAQVRLDAARAHYLSISHTSPHNIENARNLCNISLLELQIASPEKSRQLIGDLKSSAEMLWKNSDVFGDRSDLHTVLAKIQAGVILGKPFDELDIYLKQAALVENDLGIASAGLIIKSIKNAYINVSSELHKQADDFDAVNESMDSQMSTEGKLAHDVAHKYDTYTDKIKDSRTLEEATSQLGLSSDIMKQTVSSINIMGNNLAQEKRMLNAPSARRSPVPSIEVSHADYEAATTILADLNLPPLSSDIGFQDFMAMFHKKVDAYIRDTFDTESKAGLNTVEHRAKFDRFMQKFFEQNGARMDEIASLTNVSEAFKVEGIADCRMHAFAKQLLFDTWKRNELTNMYTKQISGDNSPELQMRILALENTSMVFMDAELSGKVGILGKYAPKLDGQHMVSGKTHEIIEEHTFNMIELPKIVDGSLVYDDNGDLIKEVRFADSFYQSEDGTTYNLGFETSSDLSQSVYGRSLSDVQFTTHVDLKNQDGQVVSTPITVKPLSRSVMPRGTFSNSVSAPRVLGESGGKLSMDIDASLPNKINEKTQTIKDFLGSLDKKQTLSEEDLISLENYANELVGYQRESLNLWIDTRRAVIQKKPSTEINEVDSQYPTALTLEDVISLKQILSSMQNNIVTIDEFNYVSGRQNKDVNPDFHRDQTTGASQRKHVFDGLYKKMTSIRDGLLETESSRYRESLVKDELSSETLRQEFKSLYATYKDIEQKLLKKFNEATTLEEKFDARNELLDNYNTLLSDTYKKLESHVDFKHIKKSLKSPYGRELYNHAMRLKNNPDIYQNSKIVSTILENMPGDIRAGFESSLPDGVSIDQLLNHSKQFGKALVRYLDSQNYKKYYDALQMVYSTDIEVIRMEDNTYGTYGKDSNGRESRDHYKERVWLEESVPRGLVDGTMDAAAHSIIMGHVDYMLAAHAIDASNSKSPDGKDHVKSSLNQDAIDNITSEMSNLLNLCQKVGMDSKKAFELAKTSTEALIHQTIESQRRNMGDHGYLHLLGNIRALNAILDAKSDHGEIAPDALAKKKLMGYIVYLYHDIGYAAEISVHTGEFDGTTVHPLTSTMFYNHYVAPLLDSGVFSQDDINLMSKAIETHDGVVVDFSNETSSFLSAVNIVDNMAIGFLDKAPLVQRTVISQYLGVLHMLYTAGVDIKLALQGIRAKVKSDTTLTKDQKRHLSDAIDDMGNGGFTIKQTDFLTLHIDYENLISINERGEHTITIHQSSKILDLAASFGISPAGLSTAMAKGRSALERFFDNHSQKSSKGESEPTDFLGQATKPMGDYADANDIYLPKEDGSGWESAPLDMSTTTGKNRLRASLLLGETIQLRSKDTGAVSFNYEFKKSNDAESLSHKTTKNLQRLMENTSVEIEKLLSQTPPGDITRLSNKRAMYEAELALRRHIDYTRKSLSDYNLGAITLEFKSINKSLSGKEILTQDDLKDLISSVSNIKEKYGNSIMGIQEVSQEVPQGLYDLQTKLEDYSSLGEGEKKIEIEKIRELYAKLSSNIAKDVVKM